MTQTKQSKYLLTFLVAMSCQALMCMDDSGIPQAPEANPQRPAYDFNDINFEQEQAKLKQEQEKLQKLQNKNNLKYRAMATFGDHAAKGFIDFVGTTASQSILEVVRRELDVRYDGRPITAVQLSEIHSGLTIINDALELTERVTKKLIANVKDSKEKDAIERDAIETYKSLHHLRNEHLNRLIAIQQKRNPNYIPFHKQ